MDKVNLEQKLTLITEHWSAKIVGRVNDMYVKLAKLKGEFLWHSHENEDEMFHVVRGELTMRLRDDKGERAVVVGPGEFIIIPKGVEHMPVCEQETHIMLIEPTATVNTGGETSERTVEPEWL